ncbi:MAG: hypothetical protein TEF_14710 [Rhizobiales bacterium NRL2]|jgi:CBS domain-containing protein|nr:MAG: hypothetical protein TEF_14710 [Rhizobiales bacterium NRL2]
MQAADVMTPNVITVSPDATVREIAERLLANRISAVPVVDADGGLLGIVSEGDLIRRAETETERRENWWLRVFATQDEEASKYVKEHGRLAREVMTRDVVTTTPTATLREIADLLERHHVKRLPVVDGGRLVGIVSRANILRGLIAAPDPQIKTASDDRKLREDVLKAISEQSGLVMPTIDAIVHDGVAQLWGLARSDARAKAAAVAAENVPGIRKVENHVRHVPGWYYGL